MAASDLVYREDGSVKGVVAGVFGIGKDGEKKPDYQPGLELHGKYVFIAEGVRGSLAKVTAGQVRPRRRARAAEVRHRHQGALAGPPDAVSARASSSTRSAGRSTSDTGGGSFMYHFGDHYVSRRLRRAPQLQEPLALALRRVPALQAPSVHPRRTSRAASASPMAPGRSPRAASSRVPEADLPGRRADRLLGRLRERAAHQGQPQRHEDRHAGGRSGLRRHRRMAARATSSSTTKSAYKRLVGRARSCSLVRNAKPLWSQVRRRWSAAYSACFDMWVTVPHRRLLLLRHAEARQDRRRLDRAWPRTTSRSSIQSRTGCSASTSSRRSSFPRPITRRTSRRT